MNITRDLNYIILKAFEEAKNSNNEYVTPEHLLYSALSNEEVIGAIDKCGGNVEELKANLIEYIGEYIDSIEGITPQESLGFQQVLIFASQQVISSGKEVIDTHHILAAIFELEDSYANYYLSEQGIIKKDLLYYLCHKDEETFLEDKDEDEEEVEVHNREEQVENKSKKSFVEKYTLKLNELIQHDNYKDSLIGRENILERTMQILCRRTKNNPIHIGEAGVGKTAITLGLTNLINKGKVPEKLKKAEIFSLDLGSMLAGTKYRGDFEERIKKVLDELKGHENPIVYIDEIHNIVGAGALGSGSLDASNLLKPYLMEGKIKFIGATTYDEYKKYFQKDKGLTRRFQPIEVKEPSLEEAIEILQGLIPSYEEYHNVKYTKESIEAAVSLSHKYINDKYLPDKAIDVIDEAGSYIAMGEDSINEIAVINEQIIEEIIAKTCNIPKKTVESNEISSLKNMENILKENIFGQNSAVEEIVRCIKTSRAGLNDDDKPVASMLFVGPTGVGKTEIAKTLAKNMGIELVRFDMSEYGEKHAASKLIGAPPGYVGYEEGGLLTDAIRKKPHCVLLLDEIEKAHIDILDVLLQIMDYATLTDNQGRKADFRNVIIIMTSNAGARKVGKNIIGFGERQIGGEAIMEEIKRIFSPEFRNRLDKIVVFNHINKDMAISIAKKELNNFKEKLSSKNITIEFGTNCIDYVAEKGISREFGAREIIRIISSQIKPLLVDEILFGKLSGGGTGTIDIVEGNFELKVSSKK